MDVPQFFLSVYPVKAIWVVLFLLIVSRAAITIHAQVIILCKHTFSFSRPEFLHLIFPVNNLGQILLF